MLAGSGNLTNGGLVYNDEQFELLRLPHARANLGGQLAGSNADADAHLTRWRQFFDKGIPLGQALNSPAWSIWEAQLRERGELAAKLRELDAQLQEATPSERLSATNGDKRNDLALSSLTERPTIERWMNRWFPDASLRNEIWHLLADVMEISAWPRASGWTACAVHYSNHDRLPRVAIYCGSAQVLVVHSERGVFFETPPATVDAEGHTAGTAAGAVDGANIEFWGEGDNRHPCVIVPAPRATEAADRGGRVASQQRSDAIAEDRRWQGRPRKAPLSCVGRRGASRDGPSPAAARLLDQRLSRPSYRPAQLAQSDSRGNLSDRSVAALLTSVAAPADHAGRAGLGLCRRVGSSPPLRLRREVPATAMRTRIRAPLAAAAPPSQAVKPDTPQRPLGADGGAVADLLFAALHRP